MNPDVLSQFLIDITRGARRDAYAADPAAVIAAAPLDEPARAAVRAQDVAALWRAGAHPMALILFSRLCGWTGDRYYATVAAADPERAAEPV